MELSVERQIDDFSELLENIIGEAGIERLIVSSHFPESKRGKLYRLIVYEEYALFYGDIVVDLLTVDQYSPGLRTVYSCKQAQKSGFSGAV